MDLRNESRPTNWNRGCVLRAPLAHTYHPLGGQFCHRSNSSVPRAKSLEPAACLSTKVAVAIFNRSRAPVSRTTVGSCYLQVAEQRCWART